MAERPTRPIEEIRKLLGLSPVGGVLTPEEAELVVKRALGEPIYPVSATTMGIVDASTGSGRKIPVPPTTNQQFATLARRKRIS